jgi:drug/metabolite transporter (DMT)-like permease
MNIGIYSALGAAALFGASTPLAKLVLGEVPPLLLAGLLYAGSGLCLGGWLLLRGSLAPREKGVPLARADYKWLAGALLSGGVLGPVLLLHGLESAPASAAALLLNLESVFTALIAWAVFRENLDRRLVFGLILISAGGVVLGWPAGELSLAWPALWIACACLCWALDNNLTRRVSDGHAVKIAAAKGLIAGAVNLCLSAALGYRFPGTVLSIVSCLIGALGFGVSLVLFVIALRHLGAARTGAYFSTAPFIGAALSFGLLGEDPNEAFWLAALLMGAGVALHLLERHQHFHHHSELAHTHAHLHDEHHRHHHDPEWTGPEPHVHAHEHRPVSHSHVHYPDIHHRHGH